jgi:outer membrane protein assembly factor BamB
MNKKLTSSGSQSLPFAWETSLTTQGTLTAPPLIAGDRLVCVTSSKIFALDLYSGEEVTSEGGFPRFLRPSFDATPPLTHSRGLVYFVDAGELIALQLSDGQVPTRRLEGKPVPRWKAPRVDRAVSVRANDNVVVVCQADPDTRATGFDAVSGERLWGPVKVSQSSPGPVEATRDALVFVSGGHLFAVNIRSGDTRFDFLPGDGSDSLSHINPPQIGEVGDKSVVVVAGKATYGVDLKNGKQLWTHSATKPSANTQWLTPAISERYNRVVIANSDNNLFVLDLTTGALQWSAEIPNLAQVRIVGDKVYAGGLGRNAKLHVFELLTRKECYSASFDDVGRFGFVTGQGILFTPGDKSIGAVPFGEQNAALFSGSASRITIDAQETQFDFRQNDFTIETWICTTSGGEIISGFPTMSGNEQHGFRVNVSEQGRVRFAIINKDASSSFAASSALTNVADGSWHHVAVVRRGASVEAYVDGISVEVNTDLRGSNTLDISGKNALNLGAFVPGAKARPQAYFKGLMRELRLWDMALDAAKLQSRMQRVLIGTEPHLIGYWRMDEADISKLKNHVPPHLHIAKPQKMRSFVTELALDTSVFPYLLDQVKFQWPYAGHWSARGEAEISTPPALERSGVLAFGAGNTLYGVYSSDGSRAWSKSTPVGASAPVAGLGCFYVLSGTQGPISLDAVTGATTLIEGFDGFIGAPLSADTRLPAPAIDSRYIAAALPNGKIRIVENTRNTNGPKPVAWEWKAPAPIQGDLSLVESRVYVVAGETLYQLDPASKEVNSVRVAGLHALAHGESVFCLTAPNTVAALAASDLKQVKATFTVGLGVVTGMAASSDLDLVVVATDKGELHGLSFATLASRWSIRVPAGSAASQNSLNSPAISGRTVFCASSSGALAAIDARTGEFRGLFFEPTSISTPPVVAAGSVYFGCDDAPPEANLLDGALHSVVLGQTHVLRLGLDYTGQKEQQPGYAAVTSGRVLELMGVDSCCIEAWVNTRDGGEVLSICPTEQSRYGLRLWLDQNGTINFTCVDLPDETAASWDRIASSASSNACDGKWHHIAVSRSGREELIIYLDGVALSTTTTFATVAKPSLSAGLKAFIGADATATTPGNYFAGMIGEIRVWDTYLTPTRISARMHDKLLGNEPDLLAYWNFDTLSIYDGTRNGHEGKLETGGGNSGYWLADLNFTHPSYPYLETEGRILQEVTSGDPGTIYQLTITARKADGAPLAGHELTLWYVRHKGETGPDTIKVTSGKDSANLKAVKANHGAENSFTTTTGPNGKVILTLTTAHVGKGPSLDVRPAFVPANERYHVNVLLDNQKLAKPAPPRLEAQAKLTQDYHWNTGDRVDHTRDRATWRAVITARNSDGRPRSGERLQLWATEHVEVEVNGRAYPINPNNYQSFLADENGELTVALSADELHAPALSVWAGFMHRDERYTIPLDREAHKKLSEVKGDELATPRMTSWKRNYDPAKDDKAIVKEGYKPHAEKVATAIQHVMSVTQEPAQGMRAGLLTAKRARLRADRRNFADMRQVAPPPRADRVTSLRTLKHIERQVPLEPDSFRQSLSQTLGFENSIGFVFSKTDLELRPINALTQVQTEFLQKPPAAPKLLGNIFEDAWNAIESAAEAVWREAQKIAIYIADQVTLVIEYADRIVQKVVNTVKEALDAVVHILKMIEAFISDVIRFLMVLFDWSGILDAHLILKQVANNQMKTVREITSRGKADFMKLLTSALDMSPASVDASGHPAAAKSANTARTSDTRPEAQAQINSVHGKYVNNKIDDHRDGIVYNESPSIKLPETPADQGANSLATELAGSLGGALSDPLAGSFGEIYESIKDLIAGDVKKVILRLIESSLFDFSKVGKLLDCLDVALNAPIEIPFLSQLYKWITGEQLTLLDVMCLALAIPTHIGYTIYTQLVLGEPRTFAKDARGLVSYRLTAPQMFGESPVAEDKLLHGPETGMLTAKEHSLAMHWTYFVFYEFYTLGSAALKVMQITKPGGEWKKGSDKWIVPGIVLDGLISKTLLYTAGYKEEEWNDLDLAWNSSLYGITVLLDLYTALDAFFLPDAQPTDHWFDQSKYYGKQIVKVGCSIAGAVLLGIRIDAWVNHKSPESDLFQTRDVLNAIGLMFTFDDTEFFVTAVGPKVASFVVAGETVVKVAAGAVHIAAVQTEHSHG